MAAAYQVHSIVYYLDAKSFYLALKVCTQYYCKGQARPTARQAFQRLSIDQCKDIHVSNLNVTGFDLSEV